MSKKIVKDWYSITNQTDVPELLIYGYIGPWDEVDFISFQTAIKNLSKSYNELKVRVHSGGGSVMDGLPIYDALVTSGMTITVVIDGMAASMASVLVQSATTGKRYIHESGTIMIHRVKGSEWGNADELRAYADMVEDREKRIKQIFVKATKQTTETVDSWFAKNTDWWINAETALELGLVDEIIKGSSDAPLLPFNKLEKMTEQAAYQFISNSITPKNLESQENNMNVLQTLIMAALAARGISVAENATEQQTANHVTNAFMALDNKVTELTNKLKEQGEAQAEALCNSAVAAGKYKADDAEGLKDLKELAVTNYTAAAKMVDKLPGTGKAETPKNVVVNVTTTDSGKKSETDPENRENWSFQDYQKNDPTALAKMQDEEPERFNKLVAQVGNSLKQKGAIA